MKQMKQMRVMMLGAAVAALVGCSKQENVGGGNAGVRGQYLGDLAVSVAIENALGLLGTENCLQRFKYTDGATATERLDFFAESCPAPRAPIADGKKKFSVRITQESGTSLRLVSDDGVTQYGQIGLDPSGSGILLITSLCNLNGASFRCTVQTDNAAGGTHFATFSGN